MNRKNIRKMISNYFIRFLNGDCSSGTEEFRGSKSISPAIRHFGEGAGRSSKGFASNAGN